MSNYKLEVENTEKLKEDINSAFAEINTELEKDDELVANDLFDVGSCITKIKEIRSKTFILNADINGVDYEYKVDEVYIDGSYEKYLYLDFDGKEIDTFQIAFKYNGYSSLTFSGDNFNWYTGRSSNDGNYYKVGEKFYGLPAVNPNKYTTAFLNKVYDGVKVGKIYIYEGYVASIPKLQIHSLVITYR